MGKVKSMLIESMNVHEVSELVNNHKASQDTGYIQFLEEQLEKAEEKILKYKVLLQAEMGPRYCVECFKYLSKGEVTCKKCNE